VTLVDRIFVVRSLLAPAPATDVWKVVGAFGRPQAWLPGITRTEMSWAPGSRLQRRCLTVLGEFRESLIEAGTMWILYTIDKGPLPVRGYRSLLGVRELGTNCAGILWASSFEPTATPTARSVELVNAVLEAGTSRLQSMFAAERDLNKHWIDWQLPIEKVWHSTLGLPATSTRLD
jgi:hypothetical protein